MAYKRNPGTKRPRSNMWLAYVGLATLAAAAVTVAVLALTK